MNHQNVQRAKKCKSAEFYRADFHLGKLMNTDFSKGKLEYAYLPFVNLKGAKLCEAKLEGTIIYNATLENTDFTNARIGSTVISACNLNGCLGIETVKHKSPSSIDYDTLILTFLQNEKSFSPEIKIFLLNAGVPKALLDGLPKILEECQI